MGNTSAGEDVQLRPLQAAYKAAFGQWAFEVSRLQLLARHSTPDSLALREARGKVEAAEIACRESRDLLAEFMLAEIR